MKSIAALAALALLAASPPPSGPTDPATFAVGSSVADATFTPLGGASRPLATPGEPAVVILFASWCVGCVDEIPRNVADYAKFKGRVAFLGVDYLDNAKAGDALIAKYALPYPVERLRETAGAVPAPEKMSDGTTPAGIKIALHGVTPATLPGVLPLLMKGLPPSMQALMSDVAAHCAKVSSADCIAYAASKGVGLDATGPTAPPKTAATKASASSAPASGEEDLSLPTVFVIDASGTVVAKIVGYSSDSDELAAALAKLGIK